MKATDRQPRAGSQFGSLPSNPRLPGFLLLAMFGVPFILPGFLSAQEVDVEISGEVDCGYTVEVDEELMEDGETSQSEGTISVTVHTESCDAACPSADPVDDFTLDSITVTDPLTGESVEIASDIEMGNDSNYEVCTQGNGEQEEFTVNYNMDGAMACNRATDSPVWYSSGQMYTRPQTDFVIDDPFFPVKFERSYASYNLVDSVLGWGWKHNYDIQLYDSNNPQNQYFRVSPTGERFFAFPYTRILDDSNPPAGEVTTVGTWSTESSGTQYVGSGYLRVSSAHAGTATVTYAPHLPQAGKYEVLIRYPGSTSSPTSAAPVMIQHATGQDSTSVDMTSGGGTWHSLGTYVFDRGNTGFVQLSKPASGYTLADAVMFKSVQFRTADGRVLLAPDGNGGYDVSYADGMIYHFDDSMPHRLSSIEDVDGHLLQFDYYRGRLSSITTPAERVIDFTYEEEGGEERISEISTDSQTLVQFWYTDLVIEGALGRLKQALYPDSSALNYTYSTLPGSDDKLLEQITDYDGGVVETHTWAAHPNPHIKTFVVTSSQSGREKLDLEYDETQRMTTVTRHVEGMDTQTHEIRYDKSGRVISDEGSCSSCGVAFEYDKPGNVVLLTDSIGRTFLSHFDSYNNKLSEVQVSVDPNQPVTGGEGFDDAVLDPLRWKSFGSTATKATIVQQFGTMHLGLSDQDRALQAGIVSRYRLSGNFDVTLSYKGVSGADAGTSFLFGVTADPNDPIDRLPGWIACEQSGTAGGWRWAYDPPGEPNSATTLHVGTHPEGTITADGTQLRIVRSGNQFTLYRDATNSLHDQDPNSAIQLSLPNDLYLFAILKSDPNAPEVALDVDSITLSSGSAIGTEYDEDPATLQSWEYENRALPTAVTRSSRPSAFSGLQATMTYDYDDPDDDSDPNVPNSQPTKHLFRIVEEGYSDENFDSTPELLTRLTTIDYYGISDPNGLLGQLKSIDGPLANDTVTYTYDSLGQIATVSNPLSQTVQYDAFDTYGKATEIHDINGIESELTHSYLGQVLTRTFDPSGLDLTSTHDYSNDLLIQRTSPKGASAVLKYDGYRRLASTARRGMLGGPDLEKVAYDYNFRGQRNLKELRDAADAVQYAVRTTYGQSADPNDSEVRDFIAVETPADSNDVMTTWMDGRGRPVTRQDAAGHLTLYGYDERGRLEKVTENHVSDGQSGFVDHETLYAYDDADHLVSVTDPEGLETTYLYDDFGRLLEVQSPDSGVTRYGYDLAGHRTSRIQGVGSADETTSTYTYDELGRLIGVAYQEPGRDAHYFYDGDNGSGGTSISCNGYSVSLPQSNAIGRLSAVALVLDPNSAEQIVTTYEYDARGLLLYERKYIGSSTPHVTAYIYDEDGNVLSVESPRGLAVDYHYDPNNPDRVLSVTADQGSGDFDIATGIAYMPFGDVKALTYGNGVELTRGYDMAYRLDSIEANDPWLMSRSYMRDERGNIAEVWSKDSQNGSPALYKSFAYDEVSRVTAADGPWGNYSYQFDRNGNRLESSEESSLTYGYTGGTNQITSIGFFEELDYDARGNLKEISSVGSTYLDYGSDNRLEALRIRLFGNAETIANFLHMPDGRRIEKIPTEGAAVIYHYDQAGNLITETYVTDPNDTENPSIEYIYLGRHRLALVTSQGPSGGYLEEIAQLVPSSTPPPKWYAGYLPATAVKTVLWALLGVTGVTLLYTAIIRRRPRLAATAAAFVLLGSGVVLWLSWIRVAHATAPPSNVYFFHNGHLGEPLVLTNNSGTIYWSTDYAPYGQLQNESGSITIGDPNTTGIQYKPPFRFPGQYADAEFSGTPGLPLYYNHWRYYQPELGNYTRPDPLGISASGTSLYNYAFENPVNLIDPDGEFAWFVAIPFALGLMFVSPDEAGEDAAPNYGGMGQIARNVGPRFGIPGDSCPQGFEPDDYDPEDFLLGPYREKTRHRKNRQKNKEGSLGEFKGTDALRQENKQLHDVATALGITDKDMIRQLHDEVTGHGYTYDELMSIAEDFFDDGD